MKPKSGVAPSSSQQGTHSARVIHGAGNGTEPAKHVVNYPSPKTLPMRDPRGK